MSALIIPPPLLWGYIFITENSEQPRIDCCSTTIKPMSVKISFRQFSHITMDLKGP